MTLREKEKMAKALENTRNQSVKTVLSSDLMVDVYEKYKNEEISQADAARIFGTTRTTFVRWYKKWNDNTTPPKMKEQLAPHPREKGTDYIDSCLEQIKKFEFLLKFQKKPEKRSELKKRIQFLRKEIS